ncbi:MAG: 2Fe-2S iron-sulfur cluster-binding protein [Treponemataceae bacterium]|jgi:carbon-monoxide dehydrogenase small subunit|nr:2Fe-2S iron-sulfur cluster-binding protein [Treponemataceae bacterium]
MKIPFILNNENIVVDTNPDTVLSTILRENAIFSAKKGCDKGFCGACTVLLNNKPVPSCIVPMAIVKDSTIITLEYFCNTEDYQDIKNGFKAADIELCGYCNAGKIFEAYEIISKFDRPEKSFVTKQVSHFPCNCTETAVLVDGILLAANYRRKRLSENTTGKDHGKK